MRSQFFIGGSEVFIRSGNLSELVRRIFTDFEGSQTFEDKSLSVPDENVPQTVWRNSQTHSPFITGSVMNGKPTCDTQFATLPVRTKWPYRFGDSGSVPDCNSG